MELTVGECLKLPSLADAEVLGGKQGLSHRVYSCTVLEWSDRKMFKPPYFRDGDIVVTSFYYEKSDIAAQCATIRQLHGVGTAALVLFHVGTIVPSVDPALIALADELDYPLILIPTHRDVGYSEVIQDVMESIFFKKSAQNRFTDVVLQRFSSLPEAQQNISKLLEFISQSTQSILSQLFQCLILDKAMRPILHFDISKHTDIFCVYFFLILHTRRSAGCDKAAGGIITVDPAGSPDKKSSGSLCYSQRLSYSIGSNIDSKGKVYLFPKHTGNPAHDGHFHNIDVLSNVKRDTSCIFDQISMRTAPFQRRGILQGSIDHLFQIAFITEITRQ